MADERKDPRDDVVVWNLEADGRWSLEARLAAPTGVPASGRVALQAEVRVEGGAPVLVLRARGRAP